MAGIPDIPQPVHHTTVDNLSNFVVSVFSAEPPTLRFTYDYTGDSESFSLWFTLVTFSARQTPTQSKLRFSLYDAPWGEDSEIPVKFAGPIVHTRLEILNAVNGSILNVKYFRSEIDWSGV